MKKSLAERFWAKVQLAGPNECWQWEGRVIPEGYGHFYQPIGRTRLAHRWSYMLTYGDIPAGLVLDHVCHTRDKTCTGGPRCAHRRCVNPAHLEAVTQKANVRRGLTAEFQRRKTHCPQGHEYDERNTIYRSSTGPNFRRNCRTCKNERRRQARVHSKELHLAHAVALAGVPPHT